MTRYPRAGKGRKWTILELKAVPVTWRGDTLSDGDGLVGEVRVSSEGAISMRFKYAFKWESKVCWHQCGSFPAVGMEEIRSRRDAARQLLKSGVNPNDQKKANRIEAQVAVEKVLELAEEHRAGRLTFHDMFEAWIADGVSRADNNKELRRAFEKDLIPVVGAVQVRKLTDKQLQDALKAVGRGRERARTAQRLLADMQQMFRWAEKRKPWRALMIEGNPAAVVELRMVVPLDYEPMVRERTLSPAELVELRDIFAQTESDFAAAPDKRKALRPIVKTTQLAMWICLGTSCRIGELLKARWDNVHLEAKHWFVPKKDTKTKVDWDVFLSDFAVERFRALKALTGDSAWCFPAKGGERAVNEKTMSKQVGDRQMRFKKRKSLKRRRNDDSLVLAGGEFGEWTPHDMRRTASTMMQRLNVTPDIIDRCQNHQMPGSKVRRHYLHYDFKNEKREAWDRLGADLEQIFAIRSGDTASLRRSL